MKKLILLLLFIPLVSFGQDYGNNSNALKICSALQSNNFISDTQAERALERILSTIGASKRFVLQPCPNTNNAVATSYKGVRYILYDGEFMNSISNGNNWSNLFILAHEVGHHINGHSLDLVLYASDVVQPSTLANKRKQELEADEFAGFVLARLGGPISAANQAISIISTNTDDTNSTHPKKNKRLASIKKGYNKGKGNTKVVFDTPTNLTNAEEYLYSGNEKYDSEDFSGAIADYTKSIELDPDYTYAYLRRGLAKYYLKDFNGAIADYTKAIELSTDYSSAYYNRGLAKHDLKDFSGAIADYTKAIELSTDYSSAYYNRGLAKYYLKDFNGAIADYTKSLELDPLKKYRFHDLFKAKILNKEYKGAISDLFKSRSIVLTILYIVFGFYFMCFMCFSKWAEKYIWMRHKHKIQIDVSKRNEAIGYLKKGNQEFKNKQFVDAIKYYTKAIEIDVDFKEAYANRAKARKALGDIKGYNEDISISSKLPSLVKTKNRKSFLTKTSVENNYFYLQNIFFEWGFLLICFIIGLCLSFFPTPFFEFY